MLSLCWKSKGKSGPWSADLLDCLLTGARVAPWSVSVFSTLHILVFCSLRFIWFLESSLSSHPILCSPQGRAKVYRVGINISRLCLTIPYLNFLYCSLWIALSICLCKCVCFCFSLSLFLAFPIFSRDFHLPSIHHTSPRPLLFCITPPPLFHPRVRLRTTLASVVREWLLHPEVMPPPLYRCVSVDSAVGAKGGRVATGK